MSRWGLEFTQNYHWSPESRLCRSAPMEKMLASDHSGIPFPLSSHLPKLWHPQATGNSSDPGSWHLPGHGPELLYRFWLPPRLQLYFCMVWKCPLALLWVCCVLQSCCRSLIFQICNPWNFPSLVMHFMSPDNDPRSPDELHGWGYMRSSSSV